MGRKRPLVAMIGVDGSGKSSVIEGLRKGLSESVSKVYILKGNSRANSTGKISNHAKPPRSALISFPKMIFRALIWSWKYYFVYRPRMASGSLILSDRFYFDDVLIDPIKYRYGGPIWLVRRLRDLVPRPDIYILLDAPETVLFSRKQEVTFNEVVRLRKSYLELVAAQPHGFRLDASAPLPEVIENTRRILLEYIQGIDDSAE